MLHSSPSIGFSLLTQGERLMQTDLGAVASVRANIPPFIDETFLTKLPKEKTSNNWIEVKCMFTSVHFRVTRTTDWILLA